MLAKKYRVRKKREFDNIFKKSRPLHSENLILRVCFSNKETIKFGFVVSNKVDKRSTRRNAIKRQLRAITQEIMPKVKKGTEVVVIVKKEFPYPYEQKVIKSQYLPLLLKAGIISD